ncbi:NADPH-dependent F420 reductase [Actinomadura soli]|uniref:NADPH-dependent F420 reductase n=1 Tax=Actinomadura soli TaxID=2508997 RepID=UPI0022A7600C|nr:NAD(P)-binding domain-containing protein [Actinomadura soli]
MLGAGRMTEALASGWTRAGHDVLVGGRTPGKAADLANRIGARAGTLREAAEFGDAVLVAVLLAGLDGTLRAAGAPEGTLAGKAVIDATSPRPGIWRPWRSSSSGCCSPAPTRCPSSPSARWRNADVLQRPPSREPAYSCASRPSRM